MEISSLTAPSYEILNQFLEELIKFYSFCYNIQLNYQYKRKDTTMLWNGIPLIWPWDLLGVIFSILVSILIIVIIVRIIIRIVTGGGRRPYYYHDYFHGKNKNSALDILQERYAKGEITKEQYESMKKDLGLN